MKRVLLDHSVGVVSVKVSNKDGWRWHCFYGVIWFLRGPISLHGINHFLFTSLVSKVNVVIDPCKTVILESHGLVTHPGVLDLKTAMLLQGKPRVLSKQTDPILPPGDRRFWVPRRLAPEQGHTSHRLCLVGWALPDDGWGAVLQGWKWKGKFFFFFKVLLFSVICTVSLGQESHTFPCVTTSNLPDLWRKDMTLSQGVHLQDALISLVIAEARCWRSITWIYFPRKWLFRESFVNGRSVCSWQRVTPLCFNY